MKEVNLKKSHTARFHFNDILKRTKATEMESRPWLAEVGLEQGVTVKGGMR